MENKKMKKYLLLGAFIISASFAFNASAFVAHETIKCTYKWVNGEVVLVECCDSTQCHPY